MRTSRPDEATRATAASSLRVLTWNVGELYWPWHGNQLKDRDVDAVIAVLDELDADVVLLQELAHEGQLARLLRDSAPRYAGALPSSCGYDRHVGLLVREALAPRFAEDLLSPTRRGIVLARFVVGGRDVRAASLHLDVFRPARRRQQAEAAMALLSGDRGEDAALVIAGGDLNYDPEASRRLARADDLAVEALLGARLADVGAHAGPTLVGLLRVDRLFVGGAALASAVAQTSPRRLPLGDHAPLLCDLRLRPVADVDATIEGP